MSDRSVTIWNLLVGFTILSLIATSFKLLPMNSKYNRLRDAAADLQFGTDKELENIWDRLYRGDKSRTQRGLGLGLSLVKAIVGAHRGYVEVLSTPGSGSAFSVHLPA